MTKAKEPPVNGCAEQEQATPIVRCRQGTLTTSMVGVLGRRELAFSCPFRQGCIAASPWQTDGRSGDSWSSGDGGGQYHLVTAFAESHGIHRRANR
jgi:hypothetical protein